MKRALLIAACALTACNGEVMAPGTPTGVDPTNPDGNKPVVVDCSTQAFPPRRVRRLTRAELDAAASAAIQSPSGLSAELPADVVVSGFDTIADALSVGPLFAAQLMSMSETMSAQISAHPEKFSACRDLTATCRDTFIRDFGLRAFRRAPTTAEAAEYAQLFSLAQADGFATAAAFVAQAMLQSPFFVYRTELGRPTDDGRWALTDDELASELAFLATGSPPDDALKMKAASGELQTPSVREAELTRLLATADGQRQRGDFGEKWLGLTAISFVQKSGTEAASFDATVRATMLAEARALNAGATSYRALLSPTSSAAPAALATYYGDGSTRGLLTLGAMMAVYGKAAGSAPVQRGKAIRERLLCEELPPPPPNVDAQPPAPIPGTSARQRYAMHESAPSCQGCHQRIDLIGLGLEHYDGFGHWRDTEAGVTIDASGDVRGLDKATNAPFEGADGLSTLLTGSSQARACYATQWVRFGLGSSADSDGFACMSQQAAARLDSADAPLSSVLLALVASDGFRFRAAPAVAPVIPDEPPFVVGSADAGTVVMPPVTTGVTVMRKPNSDWATGFCEDVTVTNATAAAIDWRVVLTVTGTVTQSWNSAYEVTAQGVAFVGAAWNRSLTPGASASFGYCANK